MPVRKFRSIEEMDAATPRRPGDATLLDAIREAWSTAERLAQLEPRPGVRKFRSIEEANAAREAALRQRVRALASRRKPR